MAMRSLSTLLLIIPVVVVFIDGIDAFGAQQLLITHPAANEPFLALMSAYSSKMNVNEEIDGKLIGHPSDTLGCAPWDAAIVQKAKTNAKQKLFGVVDRGQCTFVEKTKYAQQAGIDALIVINNELGLHVMGGSPSDFVAEKADTRHENNKDGGEPTRSNTIEQKDIIPSLLVSNVFADKLHLRPNAISGIFLGSNVNPAFKIRVYERKFYDTSMVIMVAVATVLVGLGAYYSSDEERAANSPRKSTAVLRRRHPIQEIDSFMAWSFIVIASISLLVMYFFVQYIFVFVLLVFCFGATNGLSAIGSQTIDHFWPWCATKKYLIESLEYTMTLSDIFAYIPCACLSLCWYFTRTSSNAWILQNVMCCGLLMALQRQIRMNSLKIAAILLTCAFFYDIFWVFLSPLFFQQSVMVKVATYSHNGSPRDTLPVMLKMPKLDEPFHSPIILGLGDIALPGLLVSYLLRFDYRSKIDSIWSLSQGYFFPSLIGYCVGMILTDINLWLMQKGQPALLFLVPCTLGLVVLLAYKRGHLNGLWTGKPAQYRNGSSANSKNAKTLIPLKQFGFEQQ